MERDQYFQKQSLPLNTYCLGGKIATQHGEQHTLHEMFIHSILNNVTFYSGIQMQHTHQAHCAIWSAVQAHAASPGLIKGKKEPSHT